MQVPSVEQLKSNPAMLIPANRTPELGGGIEVAEVVLDAEVVVVADVDARVVRVLVIIPVAGIH